MDEFSTLSVGDKSSSGGDGVSHEEPPRRRQLLFVVALFSLEILILSSIGRSAAPPPPPPPYKAALIEKKEPEIAPKIPFPEANVSAHAYLVRVAGNGEVLAKKREWKPLPPASLTKLLTALLARELLAADEWIPFSPETKGAEPKVSELEAGEALLRDDAIRAALVASANDAALALAEAIGRKRGGQDFRERLQIFRAAANERASAIGLRDSRFQNPTGLDAKDHLATAQELARLAEYMLQHHPALWEISREIEHAVVSDRGITHQLSSTNELLKEFPALLGGKTGFTDNAKESLLLLYPVRPDRTAIIVILGSENRFGDARAIIAWLESAFP